MRPQTLGNSIFIGVLTAAAVEIGYEMQHYQSWSDLGTIAFVGKTLVRIGTVAGAYVGGRIIPTRSE